MSRRPRSMANVTYVLRQQPGKLDSTKATPFAGPGTLRGFRQLRDTDTATHEPGVESALCQQEYG